MSRDEERYGPRAVLRPGPFYCGINGAPPAANLSQLAWIKPEQQLRSLIVSEVHHGRRQWPYETQSRCSAWRARIVPAFAATRRPPSRGLVIRPGWPSERASWPSA